jgi:nucleotide-binding universal stress UspA family protein
MFKHILVPTDGSKDAQEAACAAIEFAHEEGARVTAYFALNVKALHPREYPSKSELGDIDWECAYAEHVQHQAEDALKFVAANAEKVGVPCQTRLQLTRKRPYRAIVQEATKDGCDLIYMAADTHRSWKDWFTQKKGISVMKHTTIPVLLYQH